MSYLQENKSWQTRCDSHIYIDYKMLGKNMVYMAPRSVEINGRSAHSIESQLNDFETACRASSLFLNDHQRAHMQSLLEACSQSHCDSAELFKRRATYHELEHMSQKQTDSEATGTFMDYIKRRVPAVIYPNPDPNSEIGDRFIIAPKELPTWWLSSSKTIESAKLICEQNGQSYSVHESQPEATLGRSMEDLYALWDVLGDIPVDHKDHIEEDFLNYSEGTRRDDIWHWFETQNPNFLVGEVQSGIRRSDDGKEIVERKIKEPVSTGLEYTRESLERNRQFGLVTRSGVAYDEELAGPGGMSFVLLREPDTTDQMLQDAVKQLKQDRDVVGRIKVTEVIPFETNLDRPRDSSHG